MDNRELLALVKDAKDSIDSRIDPAYEQTAIGWARTHALKYASQLLDDIIYEANGGQYAVDPKPWVWRDGTRDSNGPGHDSVYGMSEFKPRKIRIDNTVLKG